MIVRYYFRKYRIQIYGFLILLFATSLQCTLLNYFRIINIKPDIMLATLVMFSFFYSLRCSLIFSLLIGIFRDVLGFLPFGFNTIICVLWVILAREIFQRLSIEDKLIRCITLFIIIVLNNLTLNCFMFIINKPIPTGILLKVIFLESLFTLPLSLMIYKIFIFLLNPVKSPSINRL